MLNSYKNFTCRLCGFLLILLVPRLSPGQAPDSDFKPSIPSNLSGRIAFSAAVGKQEMIFVLDLDSRKVRKLIESSGSDSYPSWSPAGDKVAFSSDRDGNKEIYVADWDGANQKRLTSNKVIDDHPTWSPEGSVVAYFSETGKPGKKEEANIFIQGTEGGKRVQITRFSGRNSTPQLSPDGGTVAYSTSRFWPGWDVCIWNIEERSENCVLSGAKTYCRAKYSPKGDKLAYSYGFGDEIDIAILNLSDRSSRDITDMRLREYDAAWSPGGEFLVFAAEAGAKDHFSLYFADLSSGSVSPLLTSKYSLRYPSWTQATTLQLEAQRIAAQHRQDSLATKPQAK